MGLPPVGARSEAGERLYAAKRRAEGRRAEALGVAMERTPEDAAASGREPTSE